VTLGLCSPWQFDFRACTCFFWVNQRPDIAFSTELNQEVNWRRRVVDDPGENPPGGLLETNADFINHVYELGIIRRDGTRKVERERDDDIGQVVS
jgi:hypothetical protein